MHRITAIEAFESTDSRGNETIAVRVATGDASGLFAVPSGASTGSREAAVIAPREACAIARDIVAPALLGKDVRDQSGIDAALHALDASLRFEKIGGNTAIGVSIATAKAAAAHEGVENWEYVRALARFAPQARAPRLFVNLINGGKHAPHGPALQEHQIIPDTEDAKEAYRIAVRVQDALRSVLAEAYGSAAVGIGDEGGFTIPDTSLESPFIHLSAAIAQVQEMTPVVIGIDCAASSFFDQGRYTLDGKMLDREALLGVYDALAQRFPRIASIEDPFEESDPNGFAQLHRQNPRLLVIGDDLTTTNAQSLASAVEQEALSAIIIKPNQIGTLSDTLQTMSLAHEQGIKTVVSHRSGETGDDFIADLAYGTGSYGLKAGAPGIAERDAKYQRLIAITSRT